ncbi:hypothetical protein RJ639_017063 [Escallonia herrerae]|uniref:1-phosphatidylinositol-3-phosphate 5-kinase n=1 Tax=Escallonia herrerae TaxID=1293975 RepID=A0AA88VGT9_9ASTE|nr:hypothetical protein RJ639_017063 [Escallonia herrerae]
MGTPDNSKLSELVDMVKSWIPRRTEPVNVSKHFWMPDQRCRVCYECDSQFTIFNRKHHCRLCGRVFCAKCTENSIPAPSDKSKAGQDDLERIRVCNFCLKKREEGVTMVDNVVSASDLCLSPSLSATSLASTQSKGTCNSSSSSGSTSYSTGPYEHVTYSSAQSPSQSAEMNVVTFKQGRPEDSDSGYFTQLEVTLGPEIMVIIPCEDISLTSNEATHYRQICSNYIRLPVGWSDDEDDESGSYRSQSEFNPSCQAGVCCAAGNYDEADYIYGPHNVHPDSENIEKTTSSSGLSPDNFGTQVLEGVQKLVDEADGRQNGDEFEKPLANDVSGTHTELVDVENNGLLWLPPEPEDEEEEREAVLFNDEDGGEAATGECGYLHTSRSCGKGESRNSDTSSEVHRKAMKNVLEGHFRALITQLLQVENLSVGEEGDKDSWLEIITSLSWEAATLLKPDMSQGGGMDPSEYVKVKCIACGCRRESMVVKGVVCKKNVAHRRMKSKIDKARLLVLGGALEYQRMANHLSSFDTLLQQRNQYLDLHKITCLPKISLVLNNKRPLLERIARCTGAQIVPSIDHLSSQKLGYCDSFHVEKFLEEHGTSGQAKKKLLKTFMFFEGCPKPLGCTILLKGANGDELKKVKHVVRYGVFAAYHLAIETSFLADEGASLPELPLKSPITVALPDRPSRIDQSISIVPATEKLQDTYSFRELYGTNSGLLTDINPSDNITPMFKLDMAQASLLEGPNMHTLDREATDSFTEYSASVASSSSLGHYSYDALQSEPSNHAPDENNKVGLTKSSETDTAIGKTSEVVGNGNLVSNTFGSPETIFQVSGQYRADGNLLPANWSSNYGLSCLELDSNNHREEVEKLEEGFSSSPCEHQSILVSLSTRCVWKGTVCERACLLRIKYYGSFDKPLGRFLRDHLFDQSYRCRSCEMPSEAHVRCYTHRHGSLTISVKKFPEFILPGEREGKIWMWHRCLRCPRINGFPPATRRVVMSDAAWGLSFGKILEELSFANHAAASRVASCGHSLHRDCLRFYGFGRMVACFRYASIDVHSVSLPPPKLEFNYDNQDWIQKEADEVRRRATVFFAEVYNVVRRISEEVSFKCDMKTPKSSQQIVVLERMLEKEKEEFEESLQLVLKKDQFALDILELNRLPRQLVLHSYVWDQHLIHVARSFDSNLFEGQSSYRPKPKDKPVASCKKLAKMNVTSGASKSFSTCDSFLLDAKPGNIGQIDLVPDGVHGGGVDKYQKYKKEADLRDSHSSTVRNQFDSLEPGRNIQKVLSEGRLPDIQNLSDSLDAVWTGQSYPEGMIPKENGAAYPHSVVLDSSTVIEAVMANSGLGNSKYSRGVPEAACSRGLSLFSKGLDNMDNALKMVDMPYLDMYRSFNKNSRSYVQNLRTLNDYRPVFITSFQELARQGGSRLLLPVGINDTIVPVYDDEPTRVIAHALLSPEYHIQISDESERHRDGIESSISLPVSDSVNLLSLDSFDETSESLRGLGSTDESFFGSGSRSSSGLDSLMCTKALHPRISYSDEGPLGKVKYTVTSYYAKKFEALRTCCPSELDFIRSLGRCKKWGAQGGKSNVFFAKTLDERLIVKQVTKTELESFIKFAPAYFRYLSESIRTGSPTCLAKILGIYQVTSKHQKGGKESRMDILVMENLLFGRNITRLYDLKGSSRSRYNPDVSGSNKVLLDQNLIEAMPTSPIFVGSKAKRLLERAVWNDTAFLASVDVMDYSLLVGMDEEKKELVVGIIDFMRQYTWDKHLETWVKASGILGGPKNTSPTVISQLQYKKRFRKAISAYFVMVPDQWSPATVVSSGSRSALCEEKPRGETSSIP